MKTLRGAFALVLAAVLLTVPALAIELESVSGDGFYVRDTANVLSDETERLIVNYNADLETSCDDAQLVVVTVNYLDEDADVAATRLMNDWGVGSSQQSNGMLLLLAAGEYRGWLAVGDGLDSVFTEDMAEQYLNDYFWDYIDNDEFDKGVQTLTARLYDWYLEYYGCDTAPAEQEHRAVMRAADKKSGGGAMNILAVIVIVLLVWLVISAGRFGRMRGQGYTGGFWPVFLVGGRRRQRRPPPPPPPGRPPMGPGPGSMGPGPGSARRPRSGPVNMGMRNTAPRQRSSPPPRPSRPSGGPRGGGFGGHSGGRGAGRR